MVLAIKESAGKKPLIELYQNVRRRTMEIVDRLGASMVTVHADCVEYALGFRPEILSVRRLTDGVRPSVWLNETSGFSLSDEKICDGLICPPAYLEELRPATKKILVCPGIRPAGAESNNHVAPSTPGDAIRNGADYIVIGRPIYAAPDPVAATLAIITEIADAGAQQPG